MVDNLSEEEWDLWCQALLLAEEESNGELVNLPDFPIWPLQVPEDFLFYVEWYNSIMDEVFDPPKR